MFLRFFYSKKHKKHKRKRSRELENGSGETNNKVVVVEKAVVINGKTEEGALEVSSDESEGRLVDLDSDEVDCTIIEDDIDLEELMKQKVQLHYHILPHL